MEFYSWDEDKRAEQQVKRERKTSKPVRHEELGCFGENDVDAEKFCCRTTMNGKIFTVNCSGIHKCHDLFLVGSIVFTYTLCECVYVYACTDA